MPEEVKLVIDNSQCGSAAYCADVHQQHHLYEREMSRSESSSCSEDSACFKLNGHETLEMIPTRTLKTSVPKPAANPLQFVKIGPCDLYRSAQQQLQKVDEVKKPKKEVKDEIEDWQSNLDNWKCSRRKQQEHIIERVVEVKKLELEEHDRNRKRTKTFSEMIEDRTSKGRKLSLPVYVDENADDFSDLGICSNKSATKSSSLILEEHDEEHEIEQNDGARDAVDRVSQSDGDWPVALTLSSRHNNAATYESAIQSYETRMKCLTNGDSGDGDAGDRRRALPSFCRLAGGPKTLTGRRGSAAKIEEKLGELERVKNRSLSNTDLSVTEASKKSLGIPKVNICARKEVFEKLSDEVADVAAKGVRASHAELVPHVRSIKERLSSLEKSVEEASKPKSSAPLVDVPIRDRLSSINEKTGMMSLGASLEKSARSPLVVDASDRSSAHDSLTRVTQLQLADHRRRCPSECECEYKSERRSKQANGERNGQTPVAAVPTSIGGRRGECSSSGRSSSSEDCENVALHRQPLVVQQHFHHRSLDSLQGRDSPNGFCFERVQSLEFVDGSGGGNYAASVLSGDTDREDSGIHTADVSSSVSQIDDFDLHADSSIDADVKVSPATPPPSAIIVPTAAVFAAGRIILSESSQSADNRYGDSLAENRQPPPAIEAATVGDDREYDAAATKLKCGDLRTTANEPSEPSPNKDTSAETMFSNVLQPCNQSQLRPAAGSHEECSFIDRQDDVVYGIAGISVESNFDVDASKHVEDDRSRTNNVVSLSSKSHHPVAVNATQPSVCNRISDFIEGKLDLSEEAKEQRNENHVCGSGSGDKVLRSNEMMAEIEPASVSGYQGHPNVDDDEVNNEYSRFRQTSLRDVSEEWAAVTSAAVFGFEPSAMTAEPPKEKPPPPPRTDISDEDECDVVDSCGSGLRRMDSTKRIKKEIRLKRSSFLGIEVYDDESYLEPELESVKRPPDMTTFLQEERRLEKLLYRQSICSESDSTQGESRDSGVELDKNHMDEHSWITEDTHSRQDSEIYANASVTSEEDEIIRKEREILGMLKLEEQRNYENDNKNDYNELGEKLVLKLKELEQRKNSDYWNREGTNQAHDLHLMEPLVYTESVSGHMSFHSQTPEQSERWQLLRENRQHFDSAALSQRKLRVQGRSLQDVTGENSMCGGNQNEQRMEHDYCHLGSMPNIRQDLNAIANPHRRVPPPIPPNKPAAHSTEVTSFNDVSGPQQMTKQTLQALSAVPRSKIVATDSWFSSKKKPRQEAYNYRHWLIQEAEHRRITEYHQRCSSDNDERRNCANAPHEFVNGALIPPNDTSPLNIGSSAHRSDRSLHAHPHMLPSYRNSQSYIDDQKQLKSTCKPLPDSVIQTLTQRVQNRLNVNDVSGKPKRRYSDFRRENHSNSSNQQEKMLSVSGKKKCSHCGEELGKGAAMIIESLRLFYHIGCFKCCVCCVQLGDGLMGTDVRVRNSKLHCHSCYSNDEGLKFSCV